MKTRILAAAAALMISAPAFAMQMANTVEGTIHTYCMNGAATCRAFIEIGGKRYAIQAPFSQFAGLDGATVKMQGTIDAACPGGGTSANFTPSSKSIDVFGKLEINHPSHSPIIPFVGGYLLDFGGDKKVVVSSRHDL